MANDRLDGVIDYLPRPDEVKNVAFLTDENEQIFELDVRHCNAVSALLVCFFHTLRGRSYQASNEDPKNFVALAFKLEEGRFGQLTYIRAYQGCLRKGVCTSDFCTACIRNSVAVQCTVARSHGMLAPLGDTFTNVNTGSKKERVPRLVRMHADEMEEINEVRCDESGLRQVGSS